MKKAAICFTEYGKAVIEKLNTAAAAKGIEPAAAYISMRDVCEDSGFIKVKESVEEWAAARFEAHEAIIFVGAVGIAVRAIAPSVKDKLSDSPVIVIDDTGSYVIPILSGHVGGADKIAVTIAELIGAQPVITTSTDLHEAFSADVFARENGLKIRNTATLFRSSCHCGVCRIQHFKQGKAKEHNRYHGIYGDMCQNTEHSQATP